MKHFVLVCSACLLWFGSLSAKTFTIDLTQRQQTCEGWGVSLCWWANMCGRDSTQQLDSLIDWLVSPEGLNYNIFRYNIGGGDDPQWSHCQPHHFCFPRSGKGYRAEMEGFQDERGGAYHWERDEAQIRILRLIKQKRPDAVFEAFSNSAPWWMTISGCNGGNRRATDDNLNPEYFEDFARYLVDVCVHMKEAYGIEFATLDPFNEPVTDYWHASGSQEGCHVSTESQIAFLRVLAPMLQASGLRTCISASDETNVHQSVLDLQAYRDAGILPLVGQWNTHTYVGSANDKRELGALTRDLGIRLWQSETGDGGRGIEGNLKMARRLVEDVRLLQPAAWLDWQYVEEGSDQWSLVRCNHTWNRYERHANYYVRQHFSRYIPAGYTFVSADVPDALAAISPDGATLMLVVVHASADSAAISLQLPSGFRIAQCVQTTASAFARRLPDVPVRRSVASLPQPASSITTVVMKLK